MDAATPLEGACSCGRNHYFIYIPASHHLQVTVDDSGNGELPSFEERREPFTRLTITGL